MIARNLANLYFAQGAWDSALRTYRDAMKAGELLYQVGLSVQGKEAEMFENAALYTRAAFATARLGKKAEALLLLEDGKTHFLSEVLRLRVHRPPHVPDKLWDAFDQARASVLAEQAILVAKSRSNLRPLAA